MNKEFENYTNKVLSLIGVSGKKARQIREDIYASLIEKQNGTGESDPYILMGDPREVAEEFRENLGIKDDRFRHGYGILYGYEYISERTLFGLPLIHINYKHGFGVAKGIIAIGPVAIGLISIGAISAGLLSFGALSLGLFLALGGGAASGLLSVGGFAASGFASIGGFAAAKCFAVGGFAAADIAIGGVTKGFVGVFEQSGIGTYLFKSPAKINEVEAAVKQVYPNIGKFALKIIGLFI